MDADHTAGVVGIEIGRNITGFIFIAKDGKHLNVSAAQCDQSDKCQDLVAKLGRLGRSDLIKFEPSNEDAECTAPAGENVGTAKDGAYSLPPVKANPSPYRVHFIGEKLPACSGT